MRKVMGITYTTGLLLALLIGVIVVTTVGYHYIINQKTIGYHVLEAKDLFLVKRLDGYYIKLLATNDGSDPIQVEKIVVTDGEKTLVFGDCGREDKLPTTYLDTLCNEKIVIGPGETFILQEFQQTPDNFKFKPGVTATIYYKVLSTGDVDAITIGSKAILSIEVGGNNGEEQPPPPPPSQEPSGEFKVLFTSRRYWVFSTQILVFKVTSSVAPKMFYYDDIKGHLTITDSSGRHLKYSVLYYDKNNKVAWIAVKPSTYVVLYRYKPYTITVHFGPTGDKPTPIKWFWTGFNYYAMDTKSMTLWTHIDWERLVRVDSNTVGIQVYTDPWYYASHHKTLTGYADDEPAIYGIDIDIYESHLSTSYLIEFRTVDGKLYKVALTSCWYYGPEFRIYEVTGNQYKLIASKELGCHSYGRHTIIEIVASKSVPKYQNYLYRYVIGKPIDWIWILPTSGDYGYSTIAVRAYLGAPETPVYWLTSFFYYVSVTYQS
jgi:hypothetical protein